MRLARTAEAIEVPRLVQGNPARRKIALTFDDGPHPGRTEQILQILREENVKATFFVVGKMVDRYPELVWREVNEGHEVESHTYDHLRLPFLKPSQLQDQLTMGAASIQRATGYYPKLFRPPGGQYDEKVLKVARRLGFTMALWTVSAGDYTLLGRSEKQIWNKVMQRIGNGAIILMHDGVPQTLRILPALISNLKASGYTFVTVSEMAADSGAISTGGPRVRLSAEGRFAY